MKKRLTPILLFGLLFVLFAAWGVYAAIFLEPPQEMALVAQMWEHQSVVDVAVAGDLAYVLHSYLGLTILDISDPAHPAILSQLPLPDHWGVLQVQGDRAYVLSEEDFEQGWKRLSIVDVSDPNAPSLRKTLELQSTVPQPHDLFALPDRVYMINDDHLFAIDPDGEETPVALTTPGGEHLAVWEQDRHRYALVTDADHDADQRWYTHVILDITDEASPGQVSEFDTYGKGGDVVVLGDSAYLAGGYVYDIADPAHPRVKALFDGNSDRRLTLEGVHLVVSPGRMFDISDSAFFPLIATATMPGTWPYPTGPSFLSNDFLFVAGHSQGLLIYRYLPRTVFAQRQEAEAGSITPPMTLGYEASACGGRYVVNPQAWSDGAVTFQFDVPESDNYFLWARAKGMSWHENSFRVSFDEEEPFQYEIRPPDGHWHWAQVYPEHQSVQPFGLKAGAHTLRFMAREAHSGLDAIYLTNHPDLHPDDAAACAAPATPTPTPTSTFTPTPTATSLTPTVTPTPTPTLWWSRGTPAPFGMVPVGHFGGHPLGGRSKVATATGALVYALINNRLTVIDVSAPYHFNILGQSERVTWCATSVGIKGQTVFIEDESYGLILCDVHDPAHPQKLSSYPELKGEIHISGDRLYLVDQDVWTIFDISQPASPQVIGQISFPYAYSAVEFAGNLAYVTDERQLNIFDLSDPIHLQLVGHYQSFPGFLIHGILPQGPWVYLLGHQHHPDVDRVGVFILDVSDLAHPLARGSYFVESGSPDDIGGLALSGHDLYFGLGGCGDDAPAIIDLDVSDPDHPQQIQRTPTDDFMRPFFATEARLYASSNDLWIFQLPDLVSLPLDPVTQQSFGNAAVYQIGGMGTDVYLADGHTIRVLDNTDPSQPLESSRIRHFAADYFAGTHAYTSATAGYVKTFYVSDVTTPDACWLEHPLPMSDPDFFDNELTYAWLIAEAQGYAFVGYWKWRDWHTDIIDVHDLNAMHILDVMYDLPVDVDILDHDQQQYIVWATINEYGPTFIVMIAPLEHPHDTVGRFYPQYGYPLRQIALDGHLLVALNSIPQLLMIDLSDPENPREIGRYHLEEQVDGACTALEVVHDHAYVSCGRTVWAVDISDPANPQAAGLYIASQSVAGLHARPPIISLALGNAGMLNLQMQSIIFLPRLEHRAETSLRDR